MYVAVINIRKVVKVTDLLKHQPCIQLDYTLWHMKK